MAPNPYLVVVVCRPDHTGKNMSSDNGALARDNEDRRGNTLEKVKN